VTLRLVMQQATRSSGWLNSFRTSHSRAAQLAARIFYFRGHTTAKSSRPSNFHKICGPLLRARGHDDTPPGLSWRPESPAVLPSGVHELFDLRFHVFAEQKHRMGYQTPYLPAQPRHRMTGLCYGRRPIGSPPNCDQATRHARGTGS
jgi:hypothetical protein